MTNVVIIGGGITGLAAAWQLTQSTGDHVVTVLETSGRFGGKLQTNTFADLAVDTGPDAFLARVPWAAALCDELGLTSQLVSPTGLPSYVYSRSVLRSFPSRHVLGVPADLRALLASGAVSKMGVARAALDYVLPANHPLVDPTIREVMARRLGAEVAERLVDPLVGGINAGATADLSLTAAAPQLDALATANRSLLRSAAKRTAMPPSDKPLFQAHPHGMGALVADLAAQLHLRGVNMQTGVRVQSVDRSASNAHGWTVQCEDGTTLDADAVIVTTPAFITAQLLASTLPQAVEPLQGIRYSSVAMVRFAYDRKRVTNPLRGSGYVVPRVDGHLLTACSWASSKWAHLGTSDLAVLRASAGRLGDTRAETMTDTELIEAAHGELTASIGVSAPPIEADVTRWVQSFPQYEVGHLDRVGAIERAMATRPGLEVAGAAYRGLGIPACVRDGRAAAERVLLDH